ncbi:MAG: hypothetical protein NTW21_26830 [Verrucomicrobia bacterium]|nr:hypothetical protein [Verrucomicrobiota bacterium]
MKLITSLLYAFMALPATSLAVAADKSIPFAGALDAAAITLDRFGGVESQLIVGNGDINALVEVEGKKLIVRLSKNDIGDWRYDSSQDPAFVKISEIRKLGAQGKWSPPQGNYFAGKIYPCPASAGVLSVELPAGMSAGNAPATLDLRRAVAAIGARTIDERPLATVRALAGCNVFLVECAGRAVLALSGSKARQVDGVQVFAAELPAGAGWPGMSFAVALAEKESTRCVAIVTSFESKDPAAAAAKLAWETISQKPADLIAAHETDWQKFWSASGVDMDDPYLAGIWYRNLYFLRTVSKPGAACVGLYAGVGQESSAWHGAHTLNYNNEQTFWGGLAANHVELLESYKDLICDWIPKGRWIAKNIFEAEGTFFPHNINTYNVDPVTSQEQGRGFHLHHPWGFSLCCTGWAIQNVWSMYEYAPDRRFLEKTAYPAVKEAALFYASFLEACDKRPDGKARFGPTVVPELNGWQPDLSRNYDSTADIAYARWSLKTAIEGAEVLRQDAPLVERFHHALCLLPEYPTRGEGDERVVVISAGGVPLIIDRPAQDLNCAVTSMPVFPADEVTFFSPPAQKDLFARTIRTAQFHFEGFNEWIMLGLSRARLSMPDTVDYARRVFGERQRPNGTLALSRRNHPWNDYGHYTETFAATAVVSEMLLQSAGDAIRVFPAWPKDMAAKFANLRTRGGFLVSAEQAAGQVKQVAITSTVGGKVRLLSPWPTARVQRGNDTQKVTPDAQGVLELDTRPQVSLYLTSDD